METMILLTINWANALDVVGFGIGMVFVLLILLVVVLNLFSKMVAPKVRVRKPKAKTDDNTLVQNEIDEYEDGHLSANDSAAIAIALHLYYSEEHDVESAVITIKTVERRYSPWSSKIYGLNYWTK